MAQWKQLPFRCITPLLRGKMMKLLFRQTFAKFRLQFRLVEVPGDFRPTHCAQRAGVSAKRRRLSFSTLKTDSLTFRDSIKQSWKITQVPTTIFAVPDLVSWCFDQQMLSRWMYRRTVHT